jgi:hypothetical protein
MKFSLRLLEMYVMSRRLSYSIDRMAGTMTVRTPDTVILDWETGNHNFISLGQEIAVVPVSWGSRHLIDTALKVHELFGS